LQEITISLEKGKKEENDASGDCEIAIRMLGSINAGLKAGIYCRTVGTISTLGTKSTSETMGAIRMNIGGRLNHEMVLRLKKWALAP
jgi:hypothetical protein